MGDGKSPEALLDELRQLREEVEHLRNRSRAEHLLLDRASAAFFHNALHPVTVYDPDANIVLLNELGARNFGLPREEVEGRPLRDFVSDKHDETAERVRRVLEQRQLLLVEDRIELPEGAQWFLSILQPLSQSPPRVLVHSYDITDLKRAEENARFQAKLLDSVEQGVVASDGEGRIIYFNRWAQQLYGWSGSEQMGQHVRGLVSPPEHAQQALAVLQQGRSWTGELEVCRPDGTTVPIHATLTPVFGDDDATLTAIVGVSYDLTERKRMEQDLLRINNLESLGLLAGGIAHDFNNLLTAVLGNISLLQPTLESAQARELAADAELGARHCQQLANQLLTFSRGGAPVKEPLDITSRVEDAIQLSLRGSKSRATFAWCASPPNVECDWNQLGQVFQNLALNASQAMPSGGELRVKGEAREVQSSGLVPLPAPGPYFVVELEDTGVGISEDHMARVFDPYFTTKTDGNGLGLAIAHSVVTRHGGHITLRSVVGQGTTCAVYLPASTKPSAPTSVAPISSRQQRAGRVLIVDDDELVARVLSRMLTKLGYQPEWAAEGDIALERVEDAVKRGAPYRIVVTDLTVPGGKGGLEIVADLKVLDPGVRVVIASGYANAPAVAEYASHGFDDYIIKPFRRADLKKVLDRVEGLPPPRGQ